MKKKLLITGGTVFVSRFIAEYFAAQEWDVYVLNRGTRPQSNGVTLIQADRHALGDALRGHHFDAVIDTAYTAADVDLLLDAMDSIRDYILVSSSAVYPETAPQPFREDGPLGENRFWGRYGTDKLAAEQTLLARVPGAYILRPPYLYGPMNNVYREAFVFDCALADRPFYLPGDGRMKLQFFHIRDLCHCMDTLLAIHPEQHIFNVGNPEAVSIQEWATLCYRAAGKVPRFIPVLDGREQRQYFPFYNYEYMLDISQQRSLLPEVTPLEEGLREALAWYTGHAELVSRKPLQDYIDSHLKSIAKEENA